MLSLLHHDETGLWGQMRDISAAVSCKTSSESQSGVVLLASLLLLGSTAAVAFLAKVSLRDVLVVGKSLLVVSASESERAAPQVLA